MLPRRIGPRAWAAALVLITLPVSAHGREIDLHLKLPWEKAPARSASVERSVALADATLESFPRLSGAQATAVPAPAPQGPAPPVVLPPASPDTSPPVPTPPDSSRPGRRRVVRPGELRWLALGTALLIPSDRSTVKWFDPDLEENPPGDEEGKAVSSLGTGLPIATMILAPALLDGKYGRKTTRLTTMAVLNAGLLTEGVKFVVGRERPLESGGAFHIHGPGSGFDSFPSAHTSTAFAAATVLGSRYPRYKLPLYLLAAGVGVARINAARHFPSDVFVGASIGIYSGRLVLRRGGKIHLWR